MKKKASRSQSYKSRINWVDETSLPTREEYYRYVEMARRRRMKEMGAAAIEKRLILKKNNGRFKKSGKIKTTMHR